MPAYETAGVVPRERVEVHIERTACAA